jgi:hypothetical protein
MGLNKSGQFGGVLWRFFGAFKSAGQCTRLAWFPVKSVAQRTTVFVQQVKTAVHAVRFGLRDLTFALHLVCTEARGGRVMQAIQIMSRQAPLAANRSPPMRAGGGLQISLS